MADLVLVSVIIGFTALCTAYISWLVAWPPFTADLPAASGSLAELRCDVWLTRRNTFGPLHLTPREQPAIGPASFRSEGAEFTRDYVLFPSGLLAPPHLRLGG